MDREEIKQKIIALMWYKHHLIGKSLNYMTEEDAREIRTWSDDKLWYVFSNIKNLVTHYDKWDDPELCPFCILYGGGSIFCDSMPGCEYCGYAKRHGDCIENDESDYAKISDHFDRKGYDPSICSAVIGLTEKESIKQLFN